MGIRGELFSTKISCEGRTYFFNVKENRMGDVFLSIVESKPTEAENFDRRSIVIFREDMRGFLDAFQGALKFMEKPGRTPNAVTFNPEPDPPSPESTAAFEKAMAARRAKAPGAGAEGAPSGGEKKRRVVVKRKPEAPSDGE
jgi:hypothetical protein